MESIVRVTVVYLGGSRGETGLAEESWSFPEGSTLRDVAEAVAARYPKLRPRLPSVRCSQNHEFAELSEPLASGDEVALIPPVAGGTDTPRVWIQSDPIDVGALIEKVARADVGAVVTFIGTVRNHARGRAVVELHYEAYEPMATRVLDRIAQRAEQDYPGVRIAIVHRVGTLTVGEKSVAIAAASPNRDEAESSCREVLEALKADVPIWKREKSDDGEEWVGWGGG